MGCTMACLDPNLLQNSSAKMATLRSVVRTPSFLHRRTVLDQMVEHLARFKVDTAGRHICVRRTFLVLQDEKFEAFMLLLMFVDVLCVLSEALIDSIGCVDKHEHRRLAGAAGILNSGCNIDFATTVAKTARNISIT